MTPSTGAKKLNDCPSGLMAAPVRLGFPKNSERLMGELEAEEETGNAFIK
jgi:hypothetical protein